MTDMQKFNGNVSNILLASLPAASFGAFLVWMLNEETNNTIEESSSSLIIWGIFSLILLSFFIFYASLLSIEMILKVKINYYIVLNDKNLNGK